jgi:hypothetical protein
VLLVFVVLAHHFRRMVHFNVKSHTDADRAASQGLAATTSGGVDSWRSEYAEIFAGKDVCIVPDNDTPGTRYQMTACASLYGRVRSLKVASIARQPDFRRWADAGGTADPLRRLHTLGPEWKRQTARNYSIRFMLSSDDSFR